MAKDIPTWYHGSITGDEATKILTKFKQPGAFLLRDSQNKEGAFTLTVSGPFEKTDHFVDVKHYRIAKNRLHTLKSSKRKFPSIKDLEKCVHQQESASGETLSRLLATPVEKSLVDEWDQTDASWRDKFGVQEGKHDKHDTVKAKASKDSIISSKFPRFILRKSKKSDVSEEDNSYVKLETSNSRHNELDGYLKKSCDSSENVGGIQTVNKEVETIAESSNRGDDNQMGNVNIGIYMSTVGTYTRNNGVARSREIGERGSADQATDINNGIYMSSEHATIMDNKVPRSDEVHVSRSVDQNNASNSGIYMSSEHATTKDNKVPRSDEVDVSSSVEQNNASNSGIYMSSEHATKI